MNVNLGWVGRVFEIVLLASEILANPPLQDIGLCDRASMNLLVKCECKSRLGRGRVSEIVLLASDILANPPLQDIGLCDRGYLLLYILF